MLGLAVVALAWWLCTAVLPAEGAMARRFAPGPTLSALAMLLTGPDLPGHILVSLRRIAVGLGLALAVGVPLGWPSAASDGWRRRCRPPCSSCA